MNATGPARVARKAMMKVLKHAKPVHSASIYACASCRNLCTGIVYALHLMILMLHCSKEQAALPLLGRLLESQLPDSLTFPNSKESKSQM